MIRLACLFSLVLALPVSALEDPGAAAKRDFAGFLKLFEGEFDNFQQVFDAKEAKGAEIHEHIHSIFKRVALPGLGEDVSPSSTWVNPEATRVGINLRWIQAGFTREGVQ